LFTPKPSAQEDERWGVLFVEKKVAKTNAKTSQNLDNKKGDSPLIDI
jgi:hypothetical protein